MHFICFPVSFYLSESSKIYKLVEIFSLGENIEPLIFYFFIISSCIFLVLYIPGSVFYKFFFKALNESIICILILISFINISMGLGATLTNRISPLLSVLSIDHEIFFIYKLIILPGIYLVYSLILLFVFRSKSFSTEGYNKKEVVVYVLKNSLIFFHLTFMVYTTYSIIKYTDFFDNEGVTAFLYEILTYTFLFITIYVGLSSCVGKIKLFNNLFKKTFLFYLLSLIALPFLPMVLSKIYESEINITEVIITAILITISAYIINTIISRLFK
ncbi:hypothetical protein ES703_10701 [subsurface metagenome]